jgi:hypothetical protein
VEGADDFGAALLAGRAEALAEAGIRLNLQVREPGSGADGNAQAAFRLFGPYLNNPTRRNQRRVGVGEQVFYLFVREIAAVQEGQDKDSKMSIITSAIQD